jgi:hypothetical protein
MQNPQQLQTTAPAGTWIPQQAENAGSGMFMKTLLKLNFVILMLLSLLRLSHVE